MIEIEQLNQEQLEKVSGGVTAYADPNEVRWKWSIGDVVYNSDCHTGDWKVLNTYVGFETHAGVQYYYAMVHLVKDGVHCRVYDEDCLTNR